MKPRLLFIGATPPPFHGVLVQNERILNSRLRDEFEIIHLDTSDHRDLNNLGKVDFGNLYGGIIQLLKLLYLKFRYRPDIVYMTLAQNRVAFLRDGLFIIIAKLFSKTKSVVHFRGGNYLNFYKRESNSFKTIMDFVYKRIDYGIVLGKNLKVMVSGWIDDSNIFIIPNGTSFNPNIEARKSKTEIINLGYIGLLSPAKGTNELIEVFLTLCNQYKNLKLVLAGDFAYNETAFKEGILKKIENSGSKENIILLGGVKGKEKEDFFLNTDIFVFPSYMEGHPNAVIEAMAACCPIVASDVGAVSESVAEGFNGYLIKVKDVDILREKIEVLVNDFDLRKVMGRNSRKFYEEEFTSEKNIEKMISAFKEVLKSGDVVTK